MFKNHAHSVIIAFFCFLMAALLGFSLTDMFSGLKKSREKENAISLSVETFNGTEDETVS